MSGCWLHWVQRPRLYTWLGSARSTLGVACQARGRPKQLIAELYAAGSLGIGDSDV